MCTVSYIPTDNGQFILTSNRDEKIVRPTLPPVTEVIGNTTVFFPKDKEAGGTWIAAGDNGRICCLLNGAFARHKRKKAYRRSRGRVLLEAFEYEHILDFLQESELKEVEPFTMIITDPDSSEKLIEFRWDAIQKHILELDNQSPHIWSSATLYSKNVRKQREHWFKSWIANKVVFKGDDVLNFHSSPHGEDPENDIVMERSLGIQTVSITQVEMLPDNFNMHYHDLLKTQRFTLTKEIKRNNYV